ncbi:unnamed protein product [Arabidopsis arenosa]|uniref:Uncharacterized protein n=1 Tax=Arabidopsis arenosa TaxID=38785 RepID=A0A8S2ANV9_ARAAE|nr:unnamed protein product [Arabidopsis arenosa]
MPNIEKLALPVSWSLCNAMNSFRFAFSQWKNLKTLIMAHNDFFIWPYTFEFRVVGENCSNLNNLKIMGYLDNKDAVEIVRYLQSLKRLSLRCSSVNFKGVLLLIRGLGNLAILNLTHCQYFRCNSITINNVVQASTQKLDKLIICSKNDCKVCKDRPAMFGLDALYEKYWRNDEIKELEF